MTGRCLKYRTATLILFAHCSRRHSPTAYSFNEAQNFLKANCNACHQGTAPAAGFDIQQIASPATISSEAARWNMLALRVRNGEMPPKGVPAPPADQREQFVNWITASVRAAGCAAGAVSSRPERPPAEPGRVCRHRSRPARYTGGRHQFAARGWRRRRRLRQCGGDAVPDSAPPRKVHASREVRHGRRGEGVQIPRKNSGGASRQRRLAGTGRAGNPEGVPAARVPPSRCTDEDVAQYLTLFRSARKQGQEFEPAIFFTLRAALVSPKFLFLAEPPNNTGDLRRVDAYSLASRMSYFLLGSMPDELLFDIAAAGKLQDPAVVHELIPRMLRREQAMEFAKRFVDQWLRIRQLDSDKAPDAKLFPAWTTDEEIRSDIRLQPALFFYEILKRDLSVLNLIDSTQTVATRKLARHLGETIKFTGDAQQPQMADLPKGSTRGGLLGMPAVLAVSSYPYRTSPVLRGAWILESILGTPPPPPPARCPGARKTGLRRSRNPFARCLRSTAPTRRAPVATAASTRWDSRSRTTISSDGGEIRTPASPSTTRGELPDGTIVAGPQSLKAALLDRKDLFVRNLTAKMLGYALGPRPDAAGFLYGRPHCRRVERQ